MKVLVISAHPDDETIGAGGTIARHVAAGDEVSWCVVTQGYNPPWPEETLQRAREQVDEVAQHYGFVRVFRCGLPTVQLNNVPYIELSSALQNVVGEVRPEVVYTTSNQDLNQDHRLVYEATLVATRPLPGCPVRRVLAYEIATTARYGMGSFRPTVFVDISEHLQYKLDAMAIFGTELHEWPHPRSLRGVEILARERGLSIGVEAAEIFELVREIV